MAIESFVSILSEHFCFVRLNDTMATLAVSRKNLYLLFIKQNAQNAFICSGFFKICFHYGRNSKTYADQMAQTV